MPTTLKVYEQWTMFEADLGVGGLEFQKGMDQYKSYVDHD
jgi:hypothetical protein